MGVFVFICFYAICLIGRVVLSVHRAVCECPEWMLIQCLCLGTLLPVAICKPSQDVLQEKYKMQDRSNISQKAKQKG